MRSIYALAKELEGKTNYIYGEGHHAMSVAAYFNEMGISFEGFMTFLPQKDELMRKKVISFEEFKKTDANILITLYNWQEIYDEIYQSLDASRIYVNTTWIERDIPCEICGNSVTFSSNAEFVPFLKERMFMNQEKYTMLMHCPKCGMYYSFYRPTEEEHSHLYWNYRDENYQKQRQKYEPEYTEEFNRNLYAPLDEGAGRMREMVKFISDQIDFSTCDYVLDFGGDKGQFIPKEFEKANKFVYEISGTDVVDGVQMINSQNELKEYKWDIIFCNMVMEHLSNVKEYFLNMASYMGDGTILYIEVPMERHVENSEFTYIHEHINFFRKRTFYYLAEMARVHVIKTEVKNDVIRVLMKK